MPINDLFGQEKLIVEYLQRNQRITTSKIEELLGVKQRRTREILKELTEKKVLLKCGAYKSTIYILNIKEQSSWMNSEPRQI